MYGFVITSYFDSVELCKMYDSLVKSIPSNTEFKVAVIDGGSSEDHIKRIQENIGCISDTQKDLSSALNSGYFHLLGYPNNNIENFVDTGVSQCDYMFWLHQDMRYDDYKWAEKLIFCYKYLYPLLGRLGPATKNIDNSDPNNVLRGGNQCPTLFSSEVLRMLIGKYGYVYNPEYLNIGAYEDWDNGRRLLELGLGFGICSLVDVWHLGMGTRKLRDTNSDQIYNANIYNKHWNTWEQPGFEMDMTEIGMDLRKEFEITFDKVWYK